MRSGPVVLGLGGVLYGPFVVGLISPTCLEEVFSTTPWDEGKGGSATHPRCQPCSHALRRAASHLSKIAITKTPRHTPTVAPAELGTHEANQRTEKGVRMECERRSGPLTVRPDRAVKVHFHRRHAARRGGHWGLVLDSGTRTRENRLRRDSLWSIPDMSLIVACKRLVRADDAKG